ncbi:hypothetical protein L7F22_011156 [Adiantum nelumboides]|nr:hypothetical protein [Adiantum nelumboides]
MVQVNNQRLLLIAERVSICCCLLMDGVTKASHILPASEVEHEFRQKVKGEYKLSRLADAATMRDAYRWFLEAVWLQAKTYMISAKAQHGVVSSKGYLFILVYILAALLQLGERKYFNQQLSNKVAKRSCLSQGLWDFVGSHVSLALKRRGDGVLGLDNFNKYYPVTLKRATTTNLQTAGM